MPLDIKKTIINKSKRELNPDEKNALSKGHFIPTAQRDDFRYEICKAIEKEHPPQANMSTKEICALKALKLDHSIVILPADKGRATVIMDNQDYDIRLVATIKDTIRTRTTTVVPTREKEEKQGVVYIIPMEPCRQVYIGETG
uniref:Uncharacterized protein n=1 Tax=Romanomermis culicivorax TaxID=13658 RepID=A0A915J339_ROMCU